MGRAQLKEFFVDVLLWNGGCWCIVAKNDPNRPLSQRTCNAQELYLQLLSFAYERGNNPKGGYGLSELLVAECDLPGLRHLKRQLLRAQACTDLLPLATTRGQPIALSVGL